MYRKCYMVGGLLFHYRNNVYRQVPVRQMLFITFTIQSVVFFLKTTIPTLHYIDKSEEKKLTIVT